MCKLSELRYSVYYILELLSMYIAIAIFNIIMTN